MLQTVRCSSVKDGRSQLSGAGPLNIGTKEFVNRNADRSLQFTQNAPCVDFFSGTDQISGVSFWIFKFLDFIG